MAETIEDLAVGLYCPQCGEPLCSARGLVWCSRVGLRRGFTCDYGVIQDVTLAQHQRRISLPQGAAASDKLTQPDGTGFWIFTGTRMSPSGKFVNAINDLVEVQREHVGRTTTLLVLMMGKATMYPAERFEGLWTRVSINFGGKRISK